MHDFARQLRADMTDAERHLWRRLRQGQLDGHKFRRQHALGPYIVDFVCLASRTVVELDGGQHLDSDDDRRRDAWLRGQGFRVLRFWNNDVLRNTEGVMQTILDTLEERDSLSPSPSRGEGRGGGGTANSPRPLPQAQPAHPLPNPSPLKGEGLAGAPMPELGGEGGQ